MLLTLGHAGRHAVLTLISTKFTSLSAYNLMILFVIDKNVLLSDLSHVATVNKLCYRCRKGPEPEEMDKDMILQEKEAEVRLKVPHYSVFIQICMLSVFLC